MKKYWNKVLVTKDGAKEGTEFVSPVYNSTKQSTAKNHRAGNHPENCYFCQNTNSNLTLEQEKVIIETINKSVEEKKNV